MWMSSKTLVFNTNDIMEISALAYQKLEQKYNSEFNNLCEKFISEITDIYKDSKQNKDSRIKLETDAFYNLKGEKKLTDVATDEFKKIADSKVLYMNNDFLDSEYQQIKPSFSLEEPQKNKDKSLDLDI